MNAKHTKGPWTVDAEPGLPIYINAGPGPANPVADVCSLEDGVNNEARHAEALANARLIAAAPELLASLKELARLYPWASRTDDCDGALWKQVQAAIATAEGGENER